MEKDYLESFVFFQRSVEMLVATMKIYDNPIRPDVLRFLDFNFKLAISLRKGCTQFGVWWAAPWKVSVELLASITPDKTWTFVMANEKDKYPNIASAYELIQLFNKPVAE